LHGLRTFWAIFSLLCFSFLATLFFGEKMRKKTVRKLKNSDAQIGQLVIQLYTTNKQNENYENAAEI
jgi:hypothetical protein